MGRFLPIPPSHHPLAGISIGAVQQRSTIIQALENSTGRSATFVYCRWPTDGGHGPTLHLTNISVTLYHVTLNYISSADSDTTVTENCCAFTQKPSGVVFTARRCASAAYAVVVPVCRSVRPSDTSRHCTKKVKYRITQITPYDSPGTIVFWRQRSRRNFNGVTPTGAPNRGGRLKWRFSTNISLYFRNGAR